MHNIGEEICGEYLKHILKCDFISYNTIIPNIQGEIDVIGIKLSDDPVERKIYVCEVATHTGGLLYVKNNQPDDYNRFLAKFQRDIEYVKKFFNNYQIIPMLWSPIVKMSKETAKYNTYNELIKLKQKIAEDYNLELKLVINEEYKTALEKLKNHASKITSAFSSPVMRLYQIEMSLEKHINNLKKHRPTEK